MTSHRQNHIRHSALTQEALAIGVEAEGQTPENIQANTPARHRGADHSLMFDNLGPSALKKVRIFNIAFYFAAAGLVIWALIMFAQNGQLSPEKWWSAISPDAWIFYYLPGLGSTLGVSALAVVGSIVFGMAFGIFRLLPSFVSRFFGGITVEFARAVPVLLLMIFFWRLFAFLGMGSASAFWSVFISLVLYNGSVIAELIRSGVNNLPSGQNEAGLALGLTPVQVLRQIELPQSLKAMLPAMATQLVVVIKDTALGYIIVFTELLHEARRLGGGSDSILQTLVITALIYFAVCFLTTRAVEKVFGK